MTRKIKAQDLKPGMKIEWTEYGWTHSGTVSEVQDPKRSSLFISFRAADELWMCVDKDLKVTVLKEAQPEEPTAFGACVKAAGVKYVRNAPKNGGDWENAWFSGYRLDDRWANTWEQICERGPVTVINADPFASTEPREPRVWGRWADVPELTPVLASGIKTPYRKVGGRIEARPVKAWVPTFAGECGLNKFAPFTEVLDA